MKTYQHILFWILVYAILTLLFASWFDGYDEAYYFVSLLMPVVMGTSYFFNYYLVPRFLFTRKFRKFLIYSFYMLVVSLCLELLASIISMLLIVKFGINRAGPLVTDVYTLAGVLYFVVLLKSFILLIKHYFVDQRAIGVLEEKQTLLDQGYFTVRSNRQTSRIRFEELLYIESLADYIRFHLEDGSQVTSKEKISRMEESLPDQFIRIHRSFIVNKARINSFSREHVEVGGKELPVSRSYKKEVVKELSLAQGL